LGTGILVGLSKPPATPYHRFQPIIEPNGMTKFSTCSQALKQSCKTTTRKKVKATKINHEKHQQCERLNKSVPKKKKKKGIYGQSLHVRRVN